MLPLRSNPCPLSLLHCDQFEQGTHVFEASVVRYPHTTATFIGFIPILKSLSVYQCFTSKQEAPSTGASPRHPSIEEHKTLSAAVSQKEGGDWGGQECFYYYGRTEETLAKHSLKAA